MYFFKNTAGNWILGPEPTSFASKAPCTLRRNTPTVVTVRTIEKRVLLIDRMEITDIKKNAEGDFYANYAEFVDGVSGFFGNAPASGAKWKTYKALMSQSGEDAPVARVLNQDEDDYLGDIVWSRSDPGQYMGNFNNSNNLLILILSANRLGMDEGACVIGTENDTVIISTMTSLPDASFQDGLIIDLPIEIKVRQRGTAPILLSAETNTTGDKVILTFDKKMSGYGLLRAFTDGDPIVINELGNNQTVSNVIVNNNTVEVIFVDNLLANAEYSVQFVPGGPPVESFDYGLLEEIVNFQVTNNVI